MANYYRILSAYSDDGEDLSVPVPWNLDSVDDLSVVIVGDSGKPQEIDYWNWDSQLKQIEIPNSQNFKVWRAYVYRKEDAVALFQLIESHEINAQNILEQFQKISRILESLQENEKTFLSSPDYMGGLLPNASHRASKFVSFDEDGKPVCDIPIETFDDAVRFMEKAVGEAEEAFGEIVTAKTAEFNSNAASKKEEINTLAAQAETSKNAAITAANGATAAAQAAEASKEEAAASKTSAEESATEAQGFAQAAASSQTAAQQAAQIAQATDAGKLALDKLSAGALYFNSGKLSGSNFAVPTFPFSICATVRIDAWKSASENQQTIFQCGDYGSTTDPWVSLAFSDSTTSAKLRLIMLLVINGASKTTEVNCSLDLSTFLGKMHTIIGIYRAVTNEALNWDIYIDGVKQNITSSLKNVVVSSLSGTRNWAVNTTNYNFSSQPAPANPMMLRNLYIFNFDISAEGSPYSIADYEAGRLIPPALKPSQVSLALENYTIARNATTTLVKDTSGNSNDATVKVSSGGYVAGDNDQSIKVFVDEIKTQINQSNG